MQKELKPSGVKDTNSFNKRFQHSILKLTFIYVIILASILFVSSSVLYSVFSSKLESRFRTTNGVEIEIIHRQGIPNPDDVRDDLINLLVLVNGFLLLIAGTLSYRLAEWTLNPLKKSYERERSFLADASHELRTPLSILKAEFENELIDSKKNPRKIVKIESNLEEVNRMSNLVNDLLTISRLSENETKSDETYSKINILEEIESTTRRLKQLADTQNVLISTSLPTHPIIIKSNKTLLENILLNCIKNSIIYNRPGGDISVALKDNNDTVKIIIKDSGIGISKDNLDKIFDRFYRVDKSRSRQTGGSGLGLSIVKSSIDKLCGTIDIESEVGVGTKITLSIPSNT